MELVLIIGGLMVAGLIAFRSRKDVPATRPPARASTPAQEPIRLADRAERWKPEEQRPSGRTWRILTIEENTSLPYYRADAAAFVDAAMKAERTGAPFGIELVRDPSNRHDADAIEIVGAVGDRRWHVGHLQATTAAEIADMPENTPLAGCIHSVRREGDRMWMDVKVLVPSKRDRFWRDHNP